MVRVLRSPVDAASCALLPAVCALCGSPLPLLFSAPICDVCWAEFPARNEALCFRCGDLLPPAGSVSGTCRTCRLAPPPYVRAVSYGPYEGRMRDAIHALKFEGLRPAARRLGQMLAQAIGQLHPGIPDGILMVPVPLHKSKFARRGFNQARLLARYAMASLRESHPGWSLTLASRTVVRQRPTESQAGLTPRQRRQNVRGAFEVPDSAAVTGRNVLLIDDIMTTGATVRAVAQILLRAGAANVWVATLARARQAVDHKAGEDAFFAERGFETEALDSSAALERAAGFQQKSSQSPF